MRITNLQKKALSDLLREVGLNVVDFEVSGMHKEFKVQYRYDYFSFSINRVGLQQYSIGILPVNSTKPISETGDWDYLISRFGVWAEQLAKELSTPTGWEHFESENYLDLKAIDLDRPFSSEEKKQVRKSLDHYKFYIDGQSAFGAEDKQVILDKLEELSGKLEEMNKFDWKSLLIGTLSNVVMVLGLPSEVSGLIWEGLKSAFGGLRIDG